MCSVNLFLYSFTFCETYGGNRSHFGRANIMMSLYDVNDVIQRKGVRLRTVVWCGVRSICTLTFVTFETFEK